MPRCETGSPCAESRFRILVVDDDEEFRIVAAEALRIMGAEAIEASDGLEAIRQWTRCRPAVVLLDGDMPGLDGWASAGRIRSAERRLKRPRSVLVSISADASATDAELAAMGFDHRLAKPFPLAELTRLVEQVRVGADEAPPRGGAVTGRGDGPGGVRAGRRAGTRGAGRCGPVTPVEGKTRPPADRET